MNIEKYGEDKISKEYAEFLLEKIDNDILTLYGKNKTTKEYQQEWKSKNREKQRQLQRDHYNKKKEYLLENVGSVCVSCGST